MRHTRSNAARSVPLLRSNMRASVSGSPNLTLYSRTLGPAGVSMSPVNSMPTKGYPAQCALSEDPLPGHSSKLEGARHTFFSHSANGRFQHLCADLIHDDIGRDGRGCVCTHAAGIGTSVTLANSLMVLCSRQ